MYIYIYTYIYIYVYIYINIYICLVGGFNHSEKDESQLGLLVPIYGKTNPNHQPDLYVDCICIWCIYIYIYVVYIWVYSKDLNTNDLTIDDGEF